MLGQPGADLPRAAQLWPDHVVFGMASAAHVSVLKEGQVDVLEVLERSGKAVWLLVGPPVE